MSKVTMKIEPGAHKKLAIFKTCSESKTFSDAIDNLVGKSDVADRLADSMIGELGLDFTCEDCGTVLTIFDTECPDCNTYTHWSTDCSVRDVINTLADCGYVPDVGA